MKDNLEKIALFYGKHTRHKYHMISRFVYKKMQNGEDAIEYLLDNIESMLDFIKYENDESRKIVKDVAGDLKIEKVVLSLEKLYDHIALEEERLINNNRTVEEAKNEIEEGVINTFQSIASSFEERVREISNSLNANIMTIVGLFSAIIFVFFGGVTGVSSVVQHITELEKRKDVVLPLIILLAIGFVLFNIIFLLLYSISKFTDKNIGCIVPGNVSYWYFVERPEEEGGEYTVNINNKKEKKFLKLEDAEKYAECRNKLSRAKNVLFSIFKRIVLRFPYVFIIDTALVLAMVYLYITFK